MKKCSKCGKVKNYSLFFKNKAKKDGLCTWCKECTTSYLKHRYHEKKELFCARQKKYRINNKEKIKKKCKAYRIKNNELLLKKARLYRVKNKDEILRKSRLYRSENREKLAGQAILYREANKEKTKQYRLANKEKTRMQAKEYWAAHREEKLVSNWYIRHAMFQGTISRSLIIPASIIEAKRIQLLIIRKLKEMKNEKHE